MSCGVQEEVIFKSNILTTLVAASLVLVPVSSSQGSTGIDEQFSPSAPPTSGPGWTGIYASNSTMHNQSYLLGASISDPNAGDRLAGDRQICSSVNDAICSASKSIEFSADLPSCDSSNPNNCVADLTSTKADGSVVHGAFQGFFSSSKQPIFVGDATKGVPTAYYPSIWTFPGVTHSGGDKFLLIPTISYPSTSGMNISASDVLNVALYPISIASTTTEVGTTKTVLNGDGAHSIQYAFNQSDNCPLYEITHQCAVRWPFPSDLSFGITIKTTASVDGWLHGRVSKSSVSITKQGNVTTINISGSPSTVPTLYFWKKWTELSPKLQKYLLAGANSGNWYFGDPSQLWPDHSKPVPWEKASILRGMGMFNQGLFDEYVMWLNEQSANSVADVSTWDFGTANGGGEGINNNKCLSQAQGVDGITGLTTTNANMYVSAPPSFNPKTMTLDYQVASPHLDKSGNPEVGNYDLLISDKVVRCIYGFSSAPVSASVSVVNSDGTTQIATTSQGESNGFLHLEVHGFHYSSPVIKVKVTQVSSATAASQKTISCINVQNHALKTFPATPSGCPNHYKPAPAKKK